MRRFLALFLSLQIIGVVTARAADGIRWPEDYVVVKESKSPNGRYAVLIPNADAADDDEGTLPNYLVNLKAHRILGKIRGIHYFEHANRRSLRVIWAADSSWCVAEWDGRFGFAGIAVAETDGTTFASIDIGRRVLAGLQASIAKAAGDPEVEGEGTAFYRLGADRELRLRATATTNPKRFDGEKSFCALFQGTFDLSTKKWSASEARPIVSDEPYLNAHQELGSGDFGFTSDADRLTWLDDRLNEVYGGVRVILGPARFAGVQKEQRAWLAQRAAVRSAAAKAKLTEARIRALQELVW